MKQVEVTDVYLRLCWRVVEFCSSGCFNSSCTEERKLQQSDVFTRESCHVRSSTFSFFRSFSACWRYYCFLLRGTHIFLTSGESFAPVCVFQCFQDYSCNVRSQKRVFNSSAFRISSSLVCVCRVMENQPCVALIPPSKTSMVLAFTFDVLQYFLQINQAAVHFLFTAGWKSPAQ